MFRSTTIPEITGLKEYIESIAGSFCPFIPASTRANAMRNSVYQLSGGYDQVEASIFYLGLIHTEMLRRTRQAVSPREAVLACENLIFRFEGEEEVDGKALFAWPHWVLKTEYTSVGVLFGKFWLGEIDTARSGRPIPPPPYHLLSIRSAVKKRDPQFFRKAPELLDDLLESNDDGRDILRFGALPIAQETPDWSHDTVLAAYHSLLASGMYEEVKSQKAAELKGRK